MTFVGRISLITVDAKDSKVHPGLYGVSLKILSYLMSRCSFPDARLAVNKHVRRPKAIKYVL